MKKNPLQKLMLAGAFAVLTLGNSAFALTTADFAAAETTATTVASTLNNIFFAVIPIALVIGLSIWGYRMARKLAR